MMAEIGEKVGELFGFPIVVGELPKVEITFGPSLIDPHGYSEGEKTVASAMAIGVSFPHFAEAMKQLADCNAAVENPFPQFFEALRLYHLSLAESVVVEEVLGAVGEAERPYRAHRMQVILGVALVILLIIVTMLNGG